MKKLIILLTALLLSGCTASPNASPKEYIRISMKEAASMMQEEEDYILLDVRTRAEYDASHIPGAVCIPNETISAEPPEQLPDSDQLIFVYCRSGNRSRQAAQKLADMGYSRIYEIGGILDWQGETVSSDPQ